MIPETLEGWTVEVIEALLQQGVFESDRFDFKEQLPHPRADGDKLGLVKTCASFANSAGGFLIFGVKDDKGLTPSQRLVGFDPAEDFPERFGNFPSAAEPSVEWTFRNPALRLAGGRLLHVAQVVASPRKPHAVLDQDRWWFCKRTSKGTEVMSYEEIRMAFQDTETRRIKLVHLSSELDHIFFLARRLLEDVPEKASLDGLVIDTAWTTRYPTTAIDLLLGDAFALVANKADLWTALQALRAEIRYSNSMAEAHSDYQFIRTTGESGQRARLYKIMRQRAQSIEMLSNQAKQQVDATLAGRTA